MPHFLKKYPNYHVLKKLPCFYVSINFSVAKVAKTASFREKARKLIDLAKNYATFSNKLPCFGVSMNLPAKGCKKWLNSWKRTKSHPFGLNFAIFPTNYHVFSFRWTFQEKVAKSASFREQARKTIDLAKLSTFRANYHVIGIFMNFLAKSCKSASFREKARKIIDLAKTIQLF